MKITFLLPTLLLVCSCSIIPAHKVYVSAGGDDLNPGSKSRPLQSLEAAQQAVRKYRTDKPRRNIRVLIGEGTWFLEQTLSFKPIDGGSAKTSVVWAGESQGRTVISGGRIVSGFKNEGFGIWWAPVEPGLHFEQLYVDGNRAVRARIPNAGDSLPRIYLNKSTWNYHADSTVKNISVSVKDRRLFENLMPAGEFEAVIFKDWTISRFRVSYLDGGSSELFLKPPYALFDGPYNSIFAGNANRYSCYLEGDPVFIDVPGEWALDQRAGRLYYKPLPGQSPDKIIAVAPFVEQMITLTGDRDNQIENLSFRGMEFEYSSYRLPEYNHDGMQAAFYYPSNSESVTGPGLIPPAIAMTWAVNCKFFDCRLAMIGGNGIYLHEGCLNNRIDNLVIKDIGGNGVMIGLTRDPAADSALLPVNNTVAGCEISNAGVLFSGAVGVWLGFCAGTEISDCDVYDLPYTGISVGWQWNPLPTSSKNNRIINNRIHHAMQLLGDGGGIYTLGFQPGSLIRGNEIHDILRSELNHASDNNGMFIDEGSKGYRIENNTIRNTAHTNIRGHRAAGVELISNTFYSGDQAAVSHTPPYHAMIFVNKDTTVTWANPGWPKEWGYPDTITAFTMRNNVFLKK